MERAPSRIKSHFINSRPANHLRTVITVPANKLRLLILSFMILIAIFLRFWQIREYIVFLGDEGRDMIVMRDIFTNKHLPFLGPSASVGGFYLGPIYYWMAAPFLYLAHYDPVGPAYFVAIIGVATVYLLYRLLNETVGYGPAILTSLLYATAPLIVRYSRSSWNPNPLPFFALLMIYLIYLGIKNKRLLFFLGAGASFGIAVQLHYLAVILVVIAFLAVFINEHYRNWLKIAFFSVCGFIITFSPFLIFEIRHNFPNFKTILEFVTRGSTIRYHAFNFLWTIGNTGNIFFEEISGLMGTIYTRILLWLLVLSGLFGIYYFRDSLKKRLIFSIASIWFLVGVIVLRSYTGQIHDYYFGFMYPAPFLLAGLVIGLVWQKLPLRLIGVGVVVLTTVTFLVHGFYRSLPNHLIDQTANIADFIVEKSNNQPFNFALISDSNSDHAYRYFLELKGHKPLDLETLITEQLLVVCESQNCSPPGNPAWEIVGFGRGEIASEWELPQYGFKIFRLTHWPGVPSPAGKPAVKGDDKESKTTSSTIHNILMVPMETKL